MSTPSIEVTTLRLSLQQLMVDHSRLKIEIELARETVLRLNAKLTSIKFYVTAGINTIDGDKRYHYKPARVEVNAPLALEQMAMHARMRTLKELETMLKEE